jgi:chemotaxis protein CheZ
MPAMDEQKSRTFQLSNAHGYLNRVIEELRVVPSPQKDTLVSVLQYLSDHIRKTREEIADLRPEDDSPQLFLSATDELGEIVSETARAANRIMDAAETIETVAAAIDPQNAATLRAATTNIYEASAFQDITGQRITKIVRALQGMESKLGVLLEAFGPDSRGERTDAPVSGDQALLNGPQLESKANDQADIDALFASLG